MIPERWQRIDRLFHEALACERAHRQDFLDAQCAGDEPLREEVEALISALDQAASFIETPAADVAADLLRMHQPTFARGHQIENYRIVRRLGSGGMGEVYLAEDARLDRKVALKLLPPHFMVNPDRVRRFEREARAASALNHPNIITIYDIGQANSTHFIATEFVEGKTLRQLINERSFTLSETLNVIIQVVDGLSEAHAAGIVHRDIKPENIMIRSDGYVKILDFGLAKLTTHQITDADLEKPTLLQSNPGLVMGTAQYMSPEQARGKDISFGTDIWSLGILLYELLAGHVPFSGETPSHVMVSLMENKLSPLKASANVPDELDQFVAKALRKNQRERYQTIGQLGRDLRSLRQRLQLDSRLSEWLKTVPSRKEGISAASSLQTLAFKTETSAVRPFRATTNAEYLLSAIKRHVTFAVAALLVVLATITLTYFFRNRTTLNSPAKSDESISASANQPPNYGTINELAYRYYLQGKNLTNQRDAEADKKAIANFEQAIRLDPNYAHAYAGLANAHHSLGIHEGSSPIESEKAKQAIRKALELDSNLAGAYAVRGLINFGYEWNFAASEKDLLTAIRLEPNNDAAHWAYAQLCAAGKRFEQALKEIETAQAIAPGTPMYERDRGRILYYSRRYDDAIVQLTRTLELKAEFVSARAWLWRSYEMKRDYSDAFETFIKGQKDPNRVEVFRTAYANQGWQGVKRKFLEFTKSDEQNHGGFYDIAILLAQLGDKEQAFAYLSKAIEDRRWEIAMLNVDPQLDPLREDPRFIELLRRVGLR